jgi:hypothetical protein
MRNGQLSVISCQLSVQIRDETALSELSGSPGEVSDTSGSGRNLTTDNRH